jgi:Protein of unknown function (DUF2961)
MFSIDNGSPDGWYTAWWPMPFAENAVIKIVNGSGVPIQGGKIEVRHVPEPAIASHLAPNGDTGYFHATHNQTETVSGQDYIFLDTPGRGVFYGVVHTMRGEHGNQRGYLEGNERVYNDNLLSPAWNGTGTEDFYESGHGYSVSGDAASSLSSGFPGEFSYIPVTLGLDTASSAINFRMAIDPANNGVRLTGISDQNQSYQTANVYINGAEAAFADFGAPLVLKVRHTETRGRDVGFAESGFRPTKACVALVPQCALAGLNSSPPGRLRPANVCAR